MVGIATQKFTPGDLVPCPAVLCVDIGVDIHSGFIIGSPGWASVFRKVAFQQKSQ